MQPEVGVRRRDRRCIQVDLDCDDLDLHRAPGIGHRELLEMLGRHRRISPRGMRPEVGSGTSVEHRSVAAIVARPMPETPPLIAHAFNGSAARTLARTGR